MPKYTRDMIAGYYLYFTDKCIIRDNKMSNREVTHFIMLQNYLPH